MDAFLDTSVSVATFYGEHQHPDRSFRVFLGLEKTTGCTAAHCLAETYAVVTRMPGRDRASPHEALLFLNDVRQRLRLVTLDETEYFSALDAAAADGISGGTTYHALIARCALKADAKLLYSWNTKHLDRLGEWVAARLKQP